MAMTESSREVGVVLRRRSIDNPWIDHLWSPVMVLDEVPATAQWTVLSTEADATIYYAGSASIDLFSSDTANYRDNLADGAPLIWIALRRQDGGPELELTKVTADPTEGEAMFESGCDVIGTVPMPPDIASWIAAFVDQFHVERVFHKRKRDRAGGDRGQARAATAEDPAPLDRNRLQPAVELHHQAGDPTVGDQEVRAGSHDADRPARALGPGKELLKLGL